MISCPVFFFEYAFVMVKYITVIKKFENHIKYDARCGFTSQIYISIILF